LPDAETQRRSDGGPAAVGRVFGLVSLLVWCYALAARLLILSQLPGRMPAPARGCYFTDRLIVFVECRGTLADDLLGTALSWAYFWTTGLPWLVAVSPLLLLPWLLSIFLAVRFLMGRFGTARSS
jgi:hypothetical protein